MGLVERVLDLSPKEIEKAPDGCYRLTGEEEHVIAGVA
jgi:hypothetical protein